jgi:hypothetical protein
MHAQRFRFAYTRVASIVKTDRYISDIRVKVDMDTIARGAKTAGMVEVTGQFTGSTGCTQICVYHNAGWFQHDWFLHDFSPWRSKIRPLNVYGIPLTAIDRVGATL